MVESGTPEEPSAEAEVETTTAPTGQGSAGQQSPDPEAHGEEEAPRGGGARDSTPARSPQASAGNGPHEGLEIEAGNPAPRHAPWTLARGGSSLSGARRSSAFSFVRSALDGLEAQLALEEAELNSVRVELERAWVWLLETVERCRQGDEASQAEREEARRFAK